MITAKPTPTPRPRPSPTPRTAAAEHDDTRHDDTRQNDTRQNDTRQDEQGRIRGASSKPARRASMLAGLVAAVLLLGAAATWFALEANRLRAGDPEANAALVDVEATAEVTKDVSAALESIFSYNHANLDRTRRAAERVLLDDASRRYNAKFAAASESVEERKLIRATSVRAVGVRTLGEDTARLLVFLDQQTLSSGGDRRDRITVHLEVVAEKAGGEWKIAQLGRD